MCSDRQGNEGERANAGRGLQWQLWLIAREIRATSCKMAGCAGQRAEGATHEGGRGNGASQRVLRRRGHVRRRGGGGGGPAAERGRARAGGAVTGDETARCPARQTIGGAAAPNNARPICA